MKCKGCDIDQDKNPYHSKLFFTKDGYCTRCNHKYKDRKRIVSGMDKFVKIIKIKEGSYNHRDHEGKKITNKSALKHYYDMKYGPVVGSSIRKTKDMNKNIKLERWL